MSKANLTLNCPNKHENMNQERQSNNASLNYNLLLHSLDSLSHNAGGDDCVVLASQSINEKGNTIYHLLLEFCWICKQ